MPAHEGDRVVTEVLVIGSGAGGATIARTLAELGHDVLVLEEGHRVPSARYGGSSADAFPTFYRNRGMTPIMGPIPIGFVEGACVGGSTEVNSGFWHRTPAETLIRWNAVYGMEDIGPDAMEPHFAWAEEALGVGPFAGALPPSTQVFQRGAQAMGWASKEVPRTAPDVAVRTCVRDGLSDRREAGHERAHASGCGGARRARPVVLPVEAILHKNGRATGVLAVIRDRTRESGGRSKDAMSWVRIEAENVFVCAGPTQTPVLLRQSGITFHVGNTLAIHPMMKVAARFPEPMDADRHVLPLLQVREFLPEITLGGAFLSPGHLAMLLADGGPDSLDPMLDAPHGDLLRRGPRNGHRDRATVAAAERRRAAPLHDVVVGLGASAAAWRASASLLLRAGGGVPGIVSAPAIRTERRGGPLPRGASIAPASPPTVRSRAARAAKCASVRRRLVGTVYGFENLRGRREHPSRLPGVNPRGASWRSRAGTRSTSDAAA
jgi:hypothetical protein